MPVGEESKRVETSGHLRKKCCEDWFKSQISFEESVDFDIPGECSGNDEEW